MKLTRLKRVNGIDLGDILMELTVGIGKNTSPRDWYCSKKRRRTRRYLGGNISTMGTGEGGRSIK